MVGGGCKTLLMGLDGMLAGLVVHIFEQGFNDGINHKFTCDSNVPAANTDDKLQTGGAVYCVHLTVSKCTRSHIGSYVLYHMTLMQPQFESKTNYMNIYVQPMFIK